MPKAFLAAVIACALCLAPIAARCAEKPQNDPQTWYFAVSGDSRNCGDVVVPAIAADARKHDVSLYWHLGDLRWIVNPDQDYVEEQVLGGNPTDLAEYEEHAWDDFLQNQVKPWGDVPFYLGIGNHDTYPPKSRAAFVEKFSELLNKPEIREQRLKDDPTATEPRTYYHWIRDGIDFMNLDNATGNEFDSAEMQWITGVLARDAKDDSIRTVVVGMHKALPESISFDHSMNESKESTESGRKVYEMLLKLRDEGHKNVYVIASHSHYFMDGTFNTPYWKSHGGVLPGWIIGLAGAERYPLPPEKGDANAAKTYVYGYLLATVNPSGEAPGTIQFKFEEMKEGDIPKDVVQRFTSKFVHQCFAGNRKIARAR